MKVTNDFLERLATSALSEGLVDAFYATSSSPFGDLLVVTTERGICRVGFPEEDVGDSLTRVASGVGPRLLRSPGQIADVGERFEAYFRGEIELTLPVDWRLVRSPFQREVLDTLATRVGAGEVTTYGRLATDMGHPRASRAVGTALGRNPIPIVVPCHRVVPASGGVGNYGGGSERKRFLLALEGVDRASL